MNFSYNPAALPTLLPIFPLASVVLLPRSKLPLNIFEPRYLIMFEEALVTPGRLIGMVQPNVPDGSEQSTPPVYKVGCAGRITSFSENDDGRFLVGLTGVCRFEIERELDTEKPYRQVKPAWQRFAADLEPLAPAVIDRERLVELLRPYFKQQGIEADWGAVEATADDLLISSLVMICPFAPNERQALLEAADLQARAQLMIALLEMAVAQPMVETDMGLRH